MKKIVGLLATAFMFSCSNEITTNEVAFQGKLNNQMWKARSVEAKLTQNGGIEIKALFEKEFITVRLASLDSSTYVLGTANQNNFASYTTFTPTKDTLRYETRIFPGPGFRLDAVSSAGTGYTAASNAATTGGSGAGLKVTTTVGTNGKVTSAKIISRGNNYKAGDILTIIGGDNNAKVAVLNVQQSNGEVTIEKIVNEKITGSIKFNAIDEEGTVIGFSEGYFHNVPLLK